MDELSRVEAIELESATDLTNGVEPEDFQIRFGFKWGSRQHNFLRGPPPRRSRRVAILVASKGEHEENKVACSFGEVFEHRDGTRVLHVWYVGAFRSHHLNLKGSGKGGGWGVFPLSAVIQGKKVAWVSRGTPITPFNFEALVHGSPNPYAALALAHLVERSGCDLALQEPSLPCAKLFGPEYSHAGHPSISLIYRSLSFRWEKPSGFSHPLYVWTKKDDTRSSPLSLLEHHIFRCYSKGKPCL